VKWETFEEVLHHLGDIAPGRVRLDPTPGQATERDVIRLNERTGRLYELVDGVLVEKVMGYEESSLTCEIIRLLGNFLAEHDLGNLAGADGTLKLMPGLIRVPDVSFVAWDRLPSRAAVRKPVPNLAPDLAVEVLSKGNTKAEMRRKLKDYFLAGVRVVWFVNERKRTVQVFTAPDESVVLTERDVLTGGDVLPGLRIPVKALFARVPPPRRKGGAA
jgi:Uma2 family endonuclease